MHKKHPDIWDLPAKLEPLTSLKDVCRCFGVWLLQGTGTGALLSPSSPFCLSFLVVPSILIRRSCLMLPNNGSEPKPAFGIKCDLYIYISAATVDVNSSTFCAMGS